MTVDAHEAHHELPAADAKRGLSTAEIVALGVFTVVTGVVGAPTSASSQLGMAIFSAALIAWFFLLVIGTLWWIGASARARRRVSWVSTALGWGPVVTTSVLYVLGAIGAMSNGG